MRYLKLGAALSGSLGAFAGFLGLSWRALTTFLRVCQEDLGAWGQLSDNPWEYLGMILAVWVMKMAVISRQEGTKERFDSKLWGWQNIEKTLVFHRFFDGFGRSEKSKTLKFAMNGQTCDKIRAKELRSNKIQ